MREPRTALVLAGGAARGAYEVGVIQHVVEDVARDLGRPIRFDVLCGTSVGALNACGLAAFADRGAASIHEVIAVWSSLQVAELVKPDVRSVMQMGARFLGREPASAKDTGVPVREGGLIAPEGLERLIERRIPFRRIDENLRAGHLDALTVSTTHVASGRTVVYVHRSHDGPLDWSPDPTLVGRAARITARHALASAAIPILFRAVAIEGEYHCDGGLRQNVPLSPARRLGAERVLVVNPRFLPGSTAGLRGAPAAPSSPGLAAAPLDDGPAENLFPGPLFLLGKTLNALLLDRIDTDIARLQTINRILEAGARVAGPGFVDALNREMGMAQGKGLRRMQAMLVRASQDIGRLAAEHVRSAAFAGVGGMAGRLMRRLADPDSRSESDLLSYLLFDGAFCAQLIELGRADARARHEELCSFFAQR